VVDHLPHGLIGLLVAVFFAAALSSLSAELSALGSTTTVDLYGRLFKGSAAPGDRVVVSRIFTILWGFVAMSFALFARLVENLIEAINIVGSVFYGVVLGIFLVAFFVRRIGGTAVFWAALAAQGMIFILFFANSHLKARGNDALDIGYLYYNLIGCAACVILSLALQAALSGLNQRPEA
jgi:Na+/proline symporter